MCPAPITANLILLIRFYQMQKYGEPTELIPW
jgi:hypothetical protein